MKEREFEFILIPYRKKIVRYANSLVGEEGLAEDVAQEVLLRLWNMRDRLDRNKNIGALAMKMTKNLSFNLLRNEGTRKRHEEKQTKKIRTPLDHTVFIDAKEKIEFLIEKLSPVQRELIHLRDKEEFTIDDIASITGYQKNYINVNLSRARKKLKSLYHQLDNYERKGS